MKIDKFIPISRPSIQKKEIEHVTDAVKSGWVSSLGKYIDIFEKNFNQKIRFLAALVKNF